MPFVLYCLDPTAWAACTAVSGALCVRPAKFTAPSALQKCARLPRPKAVSRALESL